MINLNYSHKPEYDLYNSITDELITGYGVLVKYIITEKVNLDYDTFGEWTSLKANQDDVHEVHLLPETQENWQGQNIMFDQFGLGNFSTMEFYISERELHTAFPQWEDSYNINDMLSDLIIVPSGKVLEITHVEPLVTGINNLFIYDDNKNTIKITCRNYTFREADEIEITNLSPSEQKSQDNLDKYFTKLLHSDEIPDENYTAKAGKIDTVNYNMLINETIYMADSLTINGVNVGSTQIQTADETNIIENAASEKEKQDNVATKPEPQNDEPAISIKDNEFSNPFGELG